MNTLGSKLGNSTLKMLKLSFFATFFNYNTKWSNIFHGSMILVAWKKNFTNFFFHEFFFSHPLYYPKYAILRLSKYKERHGVNTGGSIGTIWGGQSCIFWSKIEQNISRHLYLNSVFVFLLVNQQNLAISAIF